MISNVIRLRAAMESVMESESCAKSGRTWASRDAVRGERRREQQFYRFAYPRPWNLYDNTTVLIHS